MIGLWAQMTKQITSKFIKQPEYYISIVYGVPWIVGSTFICLKEISILRLQLFYYNYIRRSCSCPSKFNTLYTIQAHISTFLNAILATEWNFFALLFLWTSIFFLSWSLFGYSVFSLLSRISPHSALHFSAFTGSLGYLRFISSIYSCVGREGCDSVRSYVSVQVNTASWMADWSW